MNLRAQGRNRGRLFRVVTPEQAKNWPAYEAAFRAVAKLRRERMEAGNECGSALRYSALWAPRCRASRMRRGLSTTALTKIRSANLRRSRRCLVIKADMYQRSLRNDDHRSWRGHRLGEGRGGDQLLRRWQCGFLGSPSRASLWPGDIVPAPKALSGEKVMNTKRNGMIAAVGLALLILPSAAFAGFKPSAALQSACRGDAFRLCSGSLTSMDSVVACLRQKKSQATPGCQAQYDAESRAAQK